MIASIAWSEASAAFDLAARHEAQVVEHRGVQRIGERDVEHAGLLAERHHPNACAVWASTRASSRRGDLDRGEVDDLEPGLHRERLHEVRVLDELELDEDLADLAALLALDRQGLLDLALVDLLHLLEDLARGASACVLGFGHRLTPSLQLSSSPRVLRVLERGLGA